MTTKDIPKDVSENRFYDDVKTTGNIEILETPLPFGILPAFDTLRTNDVVNFNYLV